MEKVSTHRPFSRNWSNAASSQIKASPPAPPVRKPADANARIEALAGMELDGLQAEWRKLYRSQPPQRTSRHLLLLALAWKIQETAQGGSGKAVRKRLAKIARRLSQDGDVGASPSIRLKPGAQLVREWRGETYTVHVLDEGFEWQGRRYSSLSVIAREITGTRWSGPRFFGLKPSKAASLKEACNA